MGTLAHAIDYEKIMVFNPLKWDICSEAYIGDWSYEGLVGNS
jgi:hypothetical protein